MDKTDITAGNATSASTTDQSLPTPDQIEAVVGLIEARRHREAVTELFGVLWRQMVEKGFAPEDGDLAVLPAFYEKAVVSSGVPVPSYVRFSKFANSVLYLKASRFMAW